MSISNPTEYQIPGARGVLTTDHAASSYGLPVYVIDGTAYGLRDVPPAENMGDGLEWLMPCSVEQEVLSALHASGIERADYPLIVDQFLNPTRPDMWGLARRLADGTEPEGTTYRSPWEV